MKLHTRAWGPADASAVVCVHGLTQHGGVFTEMGERLASEGVRAVSVDLRGHGRSLREPPWDTETHVRDLLDTADALDISNATWIGHSFGGHLVASLATSAPERVDRLALLDPAFALDPAYTLKSAEMDRLDWSFASVDGAVNALLQSDRVIAPSLDTLNAYALEDLQRGPDGRLRFSFCPGAAVVAWSEMTHPSPAIAEIPTLLVRPVASNLDSRSHDRRYRDALGSLLTMTAVPHGHNPLWESPAETISAVGKFLAKPKTAVERA